MAEVKPTKKIIVETYKWNEIRDYVEKKHGIQVRDYARKFGSATYDPNVPYQDFWHWLVDHNEISNGCVAYMPFDYLTDPKTEEWVKEILRLFLAEFPDLDDMWVSW